jgi:general secretion pathway protein K
LNSAVRQRGVALVVALLVVALATLLIAGLLDRGELGAARTRNQLRETQALAYAQGLEAYAARILRKDSDSGGTSDSADDIWAIPLPPTPVPGGEITATMQDLNGHFNLNNLYPDATANPGYATWEIKFGLLLQALKLDPTLAQAVTAWMDSGPAADAGDNWYLGQPVPYRAARRMFAHVSELRLVRGVTGDVYAQLAPHVIALPPRTLINVNTATVPVLMTMDAAITQQTAQALWQQGHAHYADVDTLEKDPAVASMRLSQDIKTYYGVQSSYFLARGEITLDGLTFTFFSLIERRAGGVDGGYHVLQRSRGGE